MQIELAVRHLGHHAVTRSFAMQRIEHGLERFADHIDRVSILLDSQSAHHGEGEKTCRIHIHFNNGGDATVERRHEHLPGAIADCLLSTQKTIRRELERRRGGRQARRRAA